MSLFSTLEPRYNIAPTQNVLAVRQGELGGREATLLRWGLVPAWANDLAIGNKLVNARSETVAEKPSFRSAYKARRRCLIPADGFYEWKAEGKKKRPFRICRMDGEPFALAGLWERWDGGEKPVETFTILTTTANKTLQFLHDRMPVIFTEKDEYSRWLGGDDVADLLRPLPDDALTLAPVNDVVNNPRNEGPSCIDPPAAEAPAPRSLFD